MFWSITQAPMDSNNKLVDLCLDSRKDLQRHDAKFLDWGLHYGELATQLSYNWTSFPPGNVTLAHVRINSAASTSCLSMFTAKLNSSGAVRTMHLWCKSDTIFFVTRLQTWTTSFALQVVFHTCQRLRRSFEFITWHQLRFVNITAKASSGFALRPLSQLAYALHLRGGFPALQLT